MIQGLAAWLLQTYIGKYVDVDPDKLSVGLLSGVVELENVQLKLEPFNTKSLPFLLKYGYIGKIKLNISLKNLTPWLLEAENLCIIVGPKLNSPNDDPQNSDVDSSNELLNKLNKLTNLENKWFKEIEFLGIDPDDCESSYANKGKKSKLFSFFSAMSYSLLKNIHVSLKSIHIRYEDEKFSFGTNIELLVIKNDTINDEFLDEASNKPDANSFKICELNNFSIYSDSNVYYSLEKEKIPEKMNFKSLNTPESSNSSFGFLVKPTSFKAQLFRDLSSKPLRKRKKPRFKINTIMNDIHVEVDENKIRNLSTVIKNINIYNNKLSCSQISKPDEKNRPRELWKYSLNCVLFLTKKPTMNDLIKWAHDVSVYSKIYENVLHSRIDPAVSLDTSSSNNDEKSRIEKEWDLNRLSTIRRLIFERFTNTDKYKSYLNGLKETNESTAASNNLGVYGYFAWRISSIKDYYFGSVGKEIKKIEESSQKSENKTNNINDEVMYLINDSIESDSLLRRDSVLAYLDFKVKDLKITICSNPKEEIAEIKLVDSHFKLEALPRYQSFLFEMNLGSFYILDNSINSNFPVIIYPKSDKTNKKESLNGSFFPNDSDETIKNGVFSLTYEHKPLNTQFNPKYNSNLSIKSCGLDVILNTSLLEKFKKFSNNSTILLNDSKSVLFKLKKNKDNTTSNINKKKNKKFLSNFVIKTNFNFDITSPKLIIPQDLNSKNSYVIIFDFGRLILKNNQTKSDQNEVESKAIIQKFDKNMENFVHLFEMSQTEDADNDEDLDEYQTPTATPPNELDEFQASSSADSSENEFQFDFNYDLHLNDLQVISGKLFTDNLDFYINKGHSAYHFLEKFDIKIKMEIPKNSYKSYIAKLLEDKLKSNKNNSLLKLNIDMNLLKLNIDDLKIINFYRTFENFVKINRENSKKTEEVNSDKIPFYHNESVIFNLFEPTPNQESEITFLDLNLKLKELNITMSAIRTQDELLKRQLFIRSLSNDLNERKSLCELKIYSIDFSTNVKMNKDLHMKLDVSNLLLIDARQIYGLDYQLLAASYENIYIDESSNQIKVNCENLVEQTNGHIVDSCIKMEISHINDEFLLNVFLNKLDLILNAETISETIIFIYGIYLNLLNNEENSSIKMKPVTLSNEQNKDKQELFSSLNSKFNIEMVRLKLLLFHIEDQDMGVARKVALFDLKNMHFESTYSPDQFLKRTLFSLGELDLIDSGLNHIFSLDFKSSKSENPPFNIIFEQFKNSFKPSNLLVNIVSPSYIHSAKFLNDIKSCINDYKEFYENVQEEITEIKTDFEIDHLKNNILDLNEPLNERTKKEHKNPHFILIKIQAEDPILVIPSNLNYSKLLWAKVKSINFSNKNDAELDNFMLNFIELNLYSIESNKENSFNGFRFNYDHSSGLKIIDGADGEVTFEYSTDFYARKNLTDFKNETLHKSSLHFIINITNTAKVSMSKPQLDQILETIDNLVIPASNKNKLEEITCKPKEAETSVETFFKINKLEFAFLADIENPNQEIALAHFEEFGIWVFKNEKELTSVDISIKSLNVIDKLVKQAEAKVVESIDESYFKKSPQVLLNIPYLKHECSNSNKLTKNYKAKLFCKTRSKSEPNLKPFNKESRLVDTLLIYQKNNLQFYEMNLQKSFSIPDEISQAFNETKMQRKRMRKRSRKISTKNFVEAESSNDDEEEDCPLTPPPSPSKVFSNPLLTKSETRIFESISTDSLEDNGKGNQNRKCQFCSSQINSYIKIKLLIVDRKHPDFATKYKSINRHIMADFINFNINLNPETWIILLDFLGFGSKIYPVENSEHQQNPVIEEKKSTEMKLTIKKLLLNINESSAKSKIAFFNVNGISALVENKNDTNKVNGTLNTLTLNDETTIYNNLYIERLIAQGEKPIEFEFIKNSGPPELVRNKDFEVSFKLKMDSARYIHIQRFIVTLLNYFQQFFSNMDALGRMKAIAEGIHNISFSPQRGARIKLDISIQKPIIVLPINNKSYNSYILTFDSIELGNKFQMANEEKSSSNLTKTDEEKVETDVALISTQTSNEERDCFLDCISVSFVSSLIYSAYYYKDYSDYKGEKGKNIEVNFGSGYFIQHSHQILKQPHSFVLNLERNLENELSHKSPDWNIFTKLISVNFHLNWEQYNIIRGILDQNIGEPINQISPLTFMVPNTKIETILTGNIWKVIRINLDLQNVGLEFIKLMDSIAFFNFENSSLTFESFSNGSKLIDLVSNVVQAYEKEFKKPNNEIKQKVNKSKTHLHNKKLYLSKKLNSDSKRLQVELHFRINKDSNRYSILLNNCFTIIQINWIAKIKEFLGSYNENNLIFKDFKTPSPFGPINQPIVKKMEIKLNLTNTDFALIESIQNSSSQAIILRITAFLEFNEKKLLKPFQSCIQSIQFFSCQINLIDESALSILDPAMLNINLISKLNSTNSEFDSSAALNSLRNKTNIEFLLEISTDSLQFKLSYLDLRLILTIIENLKLQMGTNQDSANQSIEDKDKINSKSEVWIINNINLTINNFSMLVIDDCKDIDIPFIEIQLNRLRINQIFSEENNPHDKKMHLNFNLGQGSAEFALSISFYNRYLSGWEPLIEPWLSRFDWKMKHDKRCFTITSMDVLNLNVTNPLLDLIKTVISNWKDDFDNKSFNKSKFNKIFQPYKLINLTGQTIKFQIFENDSGSKLKTFEHDDLSRLDNNETEWVSIEDKCEKSFNFYEKKHYLFSQKHRRTASSASTEELDNKRYFNLHYLNRTNKRSNQLIQNQIRIKLDYWSEIRPLTIDKVGTYYRNLSRVNQASSTDISYSLPNDTRLIFNISLSDNATKSIEIKSPVSIKNNLNFKVQCRIEPRIEYIMNRIGPLITEIQVGDEMSIPIKYLPCNLWFRPIEFDANTEVEFSTFPINLNEVNQPDQIEYYQINCKLSNVADTLLKPISIKENEDIFYFFAKIKCHNFTKRLASTKEDLEKHQDYYSSLFNVEKKLPGHSIFLESPFTLYNFLPLEFRYKFISHANNNSKLEQIINGKIDSYNQKNFHNIDVSKQIDLLLDIDNFRIARSIEINPSKHLANFFRNQSNKEASSDSSDTESKNEIKNTKSNFLPMLSNRKLTVLRRVNFHDAKNRPLFLIAKIVFKIGSGLNIKRKNSNLEDVVNFNPCPITIQISSIYCFFNLTGLPLIFRQYNCDEASGQLEEHEMACNNQPLLFSFNEIDSPYACSMRIGKQFKDFYQHTLNRASGDNKLSEIVPKWCKPFGLDSGSSFRSLIVTNDSDSKQNQDFQIENIPNKNWVYYVGIEIKPGKGLLKDTTFVYFSTRYYLVNKSNKNLMIAQNLFIKKLKEKHIDYSSTSKKTLSTIAYNEYESKHSIVLLNDSMVQFNWPLADYDQTLSVRLKEEPNYNWSGAFKIDDVNSFYICLKSLIDSDFIFIKIDIFLDNGTFYVVFSDKTDFPFPVRIENNSEVPVYINQCEISNDKNLISINPDQKMNYAWQEPLIEKKMLIGVRGGTSQLIDFSISEKTKYLFYENFFYIVFTNETNTNENPLKIVPNLNVSSTYSIGSDLNDNELVLTARGNKIFIDKKETGNRSQLWNMTVDGLLIHEGSSPPRELDQNRQFDLENRYVLDIEDVAPRPNHQIPLTLRLPDSRRRNTQCWAFDIDGYLRCKVLNMCLQIKGEFNRNSAVVLGPNNLNACKVNRLWIRPGSGNLMIKMNQDGPTKVLNITNIKGKSYLSINWEKNASARSPSNSIDFTPESKELTYEFYINLTGGIGVSVIQWLNQEYEELIYAYFKLLEVNFDQTIQEQKLILKIQSIQVCNQLLNSLKKNLLVIPMPQQSTVSDEVAYSKPKEALKIDFYRRFRKEKILTIEHLIIDLSDVSVQIEEKLLWKFIQFLDVSNYIQSTSELSQIEEKFKNQNAEDSEKKFDKRCSESDSIAKFYYKSQINSLIENTQTKKYSFNKFQINNLNMLLSVYKASKLSNDLQKIKTSLGIPLIQFENARIECKPYILMNEYDSASSISNLIKKHYTQELRSHAIGILGSVDFLGNPLGLMVDFKESFTNVLSNGQVTDFVFSITHGVANSVSKFSGSLSEELNELTMDERHRETREQIRNIYNNGSIDHFVGGALGFAVGIVGGALSIATSTYRGFNENGVTGAFTGLGKGAVGTVSKPIVGVLDFATGIASAIREQSKTIYKMEIPRTRETRCCATAGSLLATFSRSDSNGQKILYQVNNYNLNEKFLALEQLNHSESIIGLVTNQRVLFIKISEFEFKRLFEVNYQEIKGTRIKEENEKIYLEILIENGGELKTPKFKFETKDSAISLENKIHYAKINYDETFYSFSYNADDEI